MPALVLVSADSGFSSSRSCNGLNFMVFPSSGTGAAYRKRPCRVSTRRFTPALELGRGGGVERHRQPGDLAVVAPAAHLAVAVEPGDGGAVAQRHRDLAGRAGLAEQLLDRLQKRVDPLPAQRRNRKLARALGPDRQSGSAGCGAARAAARRSCSAPRSSACRRPPRSRRASLQHLLDVGALALAYRDGRCRAHARSGRPRPPLPGWRGTPPPDGSAGRETKPTVSEITQSRAARQLDRRAWSDRAWRTAGPWPSRRRRTGG